MLYSDIKNFIIAHRKNGKRECFMWDDNGLEQYIKWSFVRNNLFYALSENSISGVGVAYALPKSFDGTIESILPYDTEIANEHQKDLVIMDWLAVNSDSRKALVQGFKKRFWNWENQKKYGMHYGKIKELSTTYINKLS